jgi:hypothetical protein
MVECVKGVLDLADAGGVLGVSRAGKLPLPAGAIRVAAAPGFAVAASTTATAAGWQPLPA